MLSRLARTFSTTARSRVSQPWTDLQQEQSSSCDSDNLLHLPTRRAMDYELAVQGAQDHRRVCIELALQEDTKGIFSEKERNWLRQRLNPTNLMCLGTFISSKSAAIKRAYPPGLFPFSPDPVCAAKLEEKLRYLDDLILSSPTAEAARLFAYSHHRTTESPYFKEARALCPRPEPTYSDIVECYVYEAVSESLETYVEDEVAVSVICRALGSRPQPIIVKPEEILDKYEREYAQQKMWEEDEEEWRREQEEKEERATSSSF